MITAFSALEFWKSCDKTRRVVGGLEADFWWRLFVERRAAAIGVPIGFKKFRRRRGGR